VDSRFVKGSGDRSAAWSVDVARELDRFDPTLPVERASMPPASWYASPAFDELEKRTVFARSWQPVARVAELGAPGAYVSGCLAGEPWVVVRGATGELRAFSNVCRHKGREVVTGSGVADGALVCGYHAWAYGFDGRLERAPRIAGILDFDRDAMSLRPLRVEVWGPWVFVNADPAAAPLAPRLAPLEASLEGGGWSRLRYVDKVEWIIECNWKVYVDNYLDGGYHIPHMHPSLDAQLDMKSYKTELFDGFSVQTSAPTSSDAELQSGLDAGARIGTGAVYAWLYPNFMLNRYGPCLDTNHVVPLGPSRCKVLYEFHFLGDAADDGFVRASMEQSAVTQREDIEICESVQRGLASRSYDPGRYAPRVEHGEHQFHRLLHADLRAIKWNDSSV
jgi:choline monooxygenase